MALVAASACRLAGGSVPVLLGRAEVRLCDDRRHGGRRSFITLSATTLITAVALSMLITWPGEARRAR